jgi:predicted membrane GTPase involved in stress response
MTLHLAFAIEAMERIKDSHCIVNHHIITILKSETAIAVTGGSYHVNIIHVTPGNYLLSQFCNNGAVGE